MLFGWCWAAGCFSATKYRQESRLICLVNFLPPALPLAELLSEWGDGASDCWPFLHSSVLWIENFIKEKYFRCSGRWMDNCNILLHLKNFQWQFPIEHDNIILLTTAAMMSLINISPFQLYDTTECEVEEISSVQCISVIELENYRWENDLW